MMTPLQEKIGRETQGWEGEERETIAEGDPWLLWADEKPSRQFGWQDGRVRKAELRVGERRRADGAGGVAETWSGKVHAVGIG